MLFSAVAFRFPIPPRSYQRGNFISASVGFPLTAGAASRRRRRRRRPKIGKRTCFDHAGLGIT